MVYLPNIFLSTSTLQCVTEHILRCRSETGLEDSGNGLGIFRRCSQCLIPVLYGVFTSDVFVLSY